MALSGDSRPDLLVLSGIEAGDSGTGRLVQYLERRLLSSGLSGEVFSRPEVLFTTYGRLRRGELRQALTGVARFRCDWARFRHGWTLARNHSSVPLLLLHPQSLGFEATLDLIEARRVPATLFLLDSSFFCVSSYNYVRGEHAPCIRCVGGNFDAARALHCRAVPRLRRFDVRTIERMRGVVRSGKVRLLAQTQVQADLAQRHFGFDRAPEVVGLWTEEFEALPDIIVASEAAGQMSAPSKYDVVFHGHHVPAKGTDWLLAVARSSPKLRFLFPFTRRPWLDAPSNCHFVPMLWRSGLEEAVRTSFITTVPSMWSAPIEGALIKSLAVAPRVAVAENSTSFAATLPAGSVLVLPAEPKEAGAALERAFHANWKPDAGVIERWLRDFRAGRERFFERLVAATMER